MRFLECLDSVLLTDGAPDSAHGQAGIEMGLALLFGEPLIISENQSFDSLGFLRLASDVISMRPRVKRFGGDHPERSPIWIPFAVGLRSKMRGHETHRRAVANSIRDGGFLLSAWPELESEADLETRDRMRAEAANAILDRDYARLRQNLQPPDDDRIDRLACVLDYFEDTEEAVLERNPTTRSGLAGRSLTDASVDWLLSKDESELQGALREELVDSAQRLRKAMTDMQANGVTFANRSSARIDGKRMVGAGDISVEEHLSVVEFLDTVYNAAVAETLNARSSHFSAENLGGDVLRLAAQDLGFEASVALDGEHLRSVSIAELRFDEKGLSKIPKRWRGFPLAVDKLWEISSNDEWQASVTQLARGLAGSPDGFARPSDGAKQQEALEHHIEVLTRHCRVLEQHFTPGLQKGRLAMSIGFGASTAIVAMHLGLDTLEVGSWAKVAIDTLIGTVSGAAENKLHGSASSLWSLTTSKRALLNAVSIESIEQ